MFLETRKGDFPGGPVVKNLPSNAGDSGSVPGGKQRSEIGKQTVKVNRKENKWLHDFSGLNHLYRKKIFPIWI